MHAGLREIKGLHEQGRTLSSLMPELTLVLAFAFLPPPFLPFLPPLLVGASVTAAAQQTWPLCDTGQQRSGSACLCWRVPPQAKSRV